MANDLKLIEISAFFKIFNSSKKTIILFTLISSLIGILIFGFQNPKYGSKSIVEIGYHRAEGNTPHTIEPVLAKIEISLYKFLKNKSIIIRPHKLSAWPSLNQNYISLEAYSNSNQKNINTIMEAQSYLIKEHNQKLKKTRKKHEDLDNIKRQAYLNEVSVLKNKIEIYINSIENYKSKLEETLDRKLIESELKSNDLLILESNLLTKIT